VRERAQAGKPVANTLRNQELCHATIWAMLQYILKAIGIRIQEHAMPAEKEVGRALYGFYVDIVVGVLGLPVFL